MLVVDPFRAPYVQRVWQRAADGEAVHALARWVQGLPDEVREGRSMSHHTIRRMLRAPVYIARSTVGETDTLTRPKMRWPALIDDVMWGQAQRTHGVYRQRREGRTHALLRDLIRCPNCGHPMVGLAPQPRQQPQYFCLARVRGAWAPDLHCYETATAPIIDALVLSQVRSMVCAVLTGTPEQLESLATAWQTSKDGPSGGNINHRIRNLEERRVSLQESWSDSAVDFVDGVIGKAQYEECRLVLTRQMADSEGELEELRSQAPIDVLPELTDVLQSAHEWSVSLDGADVLARRAVVNACVEQVVPRRVRRGQYSVQITWAPLGQILRTWCGQWGRGLPISMDDMVAFYHGAGSGDSSGLTARMRQIRPGEEDLRDLPSSAWAALSEGDRAIVRLYYGFDEDGWRSLDEVAAQFGLTRAKVMYVLKRSRITLLTHSAVAEQEFIGRECCHS